VKIAGHHWRCKSRIGRNCRKNNGELRVADVGIREAILNWPRDREWQMRGLPTMPEIQIFGLIFLCPNLT